MITPDHAAAAARQPHPFCPTTLPAGRFKEAEAVINRSLGIRRAMFGAAHPDVASCLHNLGLLLKRRNEFDKAESVYRECIEIR